MLKYGPYEGIAIAGATASGKSALALTLAQRLSGLIINADSAQVYRDLRVLSARPPVEHEQAAPHALYGTVDGAISYSAADWAREAVRIMEENREKFFPILVGGTGFYFRAIFEGLVDLPSIPSAIRQKWRTRAQLTPAGELHDELVGRDPQTAQRIARTDMQRIVRALEVIETTGRPLSELQAQPAQPLLDPSKWLRIVLLSERAQLEERIAQRWAAMQEQGALDEAKALVARGLDPAQPVMKAIGVPELAAHLNHDTGLEEAGEKIILATRQYAKRQETWFRNQMPDWQRMTVPEAEKLVAGLQPA